MSRNIVITHIKADFDAAASAWAAYNLYKCENVLTCTDLEQNVASFFHSRYKASLPPIFKRVKPSEIEEFGEIDNLIVTDCKQIKRLGHLAALVQKAKNIVIFDHHLSHANDLKGDEEHVEQMGSAVTIVLKELFKKGVEITPEDATVYLLGIYEDTGLLTFSSTTSEDILMVAKLVECGGDVTVVNDYVKREFSREQVFILNELLMNMSIIRVDGVDVAYSFASIDEYTEELAYLAHRMLDMEGLEVLFILVRSGSRISLIGRSKNPNVDVSKIVARFGGGGHPYAASASIKDLELHEALDMLKINIREHIKPVRFIREIMSHPAKALDVNATFDGALNYVIMHNLNYLPVVQDGKTVGIISRKEIMQGVKHGLTDDSISMLMQVEFEVFSPDTPFREAEDAIAVSNQRLLPIEKNGKLIGVVTSTDVLRLMHENIIERSAYEEGAKARLGLSRLRNVRDLLKKELSSIYYRYLEEVSAIAKDEGMSIYVVGGFVRDLLMGRTSFDMDIVVEGDALHIARAYAKEMAAKLTIHERYKTATVHLRTGDKIDFATARTEYYYNPGAAPTVEFSSLRNDLMRRDFTINAMAIKLDGEDFGQLIDFFTGQRDILDKKIRVLHSMSIVDDPTRAFRAIRFANRFGFELGSHTERLIKNAEKLGLYTRITGGKLFIEMKYIMQEDKYLDSIKMLKKYHMLRFVAPNLSINDSRIKQFKLLEKIRDNVTDELGKIEEIWRMRMVLLLNDYIFPDFKGILTNLNMDAASHKILLGIFKKSKSAAKGIKSMKTPKPSELYEILSRLADEELIMTGVLLGEKLVYIMYEYLEVHRKVKTELNGNDLMAMGVPESKEMGNLLKELFYAKLDGEVLTREQEEEYVRNKLRK